jgi:hypothetical protein
VHRDIKPASLFVTALGIEYDYPRVLDFRIVRARPGLSGQGICPWPATACDGAGAPRDARW